MDARIEGRGARLRPAVWAVVRWVLVRLAGIVVGVALMVPILAFHLFVEIAFETERARIIVLGLFTVTLVFALVLAARRIYGGDETD